MKKENIKEASEIYEELLAFQSVSENLFNIKHDLRYSHVQINLIKAFENDPEFKEDYLRAINSSIDRKKNRLKELGVTK